MLLDQPPEESVPIPDFRTVGSGSVPQASPNLLDTIYLCQERQGWYQDYLRSVGAEPLDFCGSLTTTSDMRAAAEAMREKLRIAVDGRLNHRTKRDAMSACIASAERAGVQPPSPDADVVGFDAPAPVPRRRRLGSYYTPDDLATVLVRWALADGDGSAERSVPGDKSAAGVILSEGTVPLN